MDIYRINQSHFLEENLLVHAYLEDANFALMAHVADSSLPHNLRCSMSFQYSPLISACPLDHPNVLPWSLGHPGRQRELLGLQICWQDLLALQDFEDTPLMSLKLWKKKIYVDAFGEVVVVPPSRPEY